MTTIGLNELSDLERALPRLFLQLTLLGLVICCGGLFATLSPSFARLARAYRRRLFATTCVYVVALLCLYLLTQVSIMRLQSLVSTAGMSIQMDLTSFEDDSTAGLPPGASSSWPPLPGSDDQFVPDYSSMYSRTHRVTPTPPSRFVVALVAILSNMAYLIEMYLRPVLLIAIRLAITSQFLIIALSVISLSVLCRLRWPLVRVLIGQVTRFIYWLIYGGMDQYLTVARAERLDGVISLRENFQGDQDALPPAPPGQPQNPEPPLAQVMIPQLAGPYSIHVSYQLKAEGLGSMGQDTADNRRICALRAADIMKKHGVRPSHIAKSIPMAVALAFLPLPEEIAAKQLAVVQRAHELQEASARSWVDPRTDGEPSPSVAFN